MQTNLTHYIRAGYPGLYIVSFEEQRVAAEFKAITQALEYSLFAWSATEGLVDTADGTSRQANDPLEVIEALRELPEKSVVLLRDFHLFLEDRNPVLLRAVKDELARAKTAARVLVIVGGRQVLPPELEHEFVVLDFDLPDKTQLGVVLDGICESAKLAKSAGDERDALLDAAGGLTCIEAENAFALSVIEARKITAGVVAREKAATVKKNGVLEVMDVRETLEDIGGLDALKTWLLQRREAFGERARTYRLPHPRGILLLGIPGTGKSLTAKAVAHILGRPLLKLDAGKLYGSLVGESENNLRNAIRVAEAIAPCILFIDEMEKGFAGSKSSASTDGGTSARVFGSFLSWMQEKTAPVFVVATANDVTQLPPEMLRKGRYDEIWFVDMPTQAERRQIWNIQIGRHGRDPGGYDLDALAKASDGYTGSEIEQAFIDALYMAFAQDREPGMLDISQALAETVPLSRLMAEEIAGLRKWAAGRCRPATRPEKPGSTQRKITA